MKRGRPFEPGNKFGRGRLRGSRNKKTLPAQQLLDEHGESIVRKALIKGLEGDARMLQTLLPYLLQRRKDLPLHTAALRTTTATELSQSFEVVLQKTCSGQITLGHAPKLTDLIEARRQLLQTEEFGRPLQVLEKRTFPEIAQQQRQEVTR
jgi:hypothetical protein